MLKATSYEKNDNYVCTLSSHSGHLNSHDKLVSGIGFSSSHSDYVSRRRAFNRGSAIIYCNKHILTTFVTLTYKNQTSDYKKVVSDIKEVFSRRHISYLAVVEKHKSGMLHIHAITSDLPNVISLRKGKFSWKSWRRGFSDVKFLSQTDDKFRVEKYIFKYLQKAEKIGGRYFLKSRDLTVNKFSYPFGVLPSPIINNREVDFSTYNIYNIDGGYCISVERRYYEQRNNIKKSKSNSDLYHTGEL